MSSITQSKANTSVVSNVKSNSSSVEFWNKAEASRFGIIPLLFILIPCLAGIAASSALSIDNLVLFVIAGAPAMVVETLILGMASMRSIIIASVISAVVSMVVIAI